VRITESIKQTIKELSQRWEKTFPESSFDYFFVDEFFNRQYQSNIRFGKIFGVFSSLTVFIACLGLFTLSMIVSRQKTKEIGLRKINGAKTSEILLLLNREFIILVIIAFFIGIPVSWYIMTKWIQSFAYKTELSWWIFALAGLIALVISLIY
jgi:putative ABC transport system permease protein